MASRLTIFQKLSKVLGPDGIKTAPAPAPRYNINKGELLRTDNKAEYEKALLTAQQNKHLQNTWKKVESSLVQQSLNYETTRIASYSDFENMEFYPEIAAALDIMMEESTTLNANGRMINVYSDSKRIKGIIEDLLFNRLDLHTSLPMWTRNTPIREDSIIPLLDGTETTIKDLSTRIKNGEEIWTYAIQQGTNALVGGKIIWCDLTRKDSELIRVTLDDGTHIDTTPDHEYMLRDGTYVRADQLESGVSLMPFYSTTSVENKGKLKGYEKTYNPASNRYRFTHRVIANEMLRDYRAEAAVGGKFLTHHKNFNKKDNRPDNLERMSFAEHALLHEKNAKHLELYRNNPEVVKKRMEGIQRFLTSDERKQRLSKEMTGIFPEYFKVYNESELHQEHNSIRSIQMTKHWSDEVYRQSTRSLMTITLNDRAFEYISKMIVNNSSFIGINKLADILKADEEFIKLFSIGYTLRKAPAKAINSTTLTKMITRKTGVNYFEYVSSIKPDIILDKGYIKSKAIYLGKTANKLINHKVVSVIKLTETSDVYCMEVVGKNGENDRHNFPVCSKDSNGNYTRNGVFLSNCKYGDNFLFLNIDQKNGILGGRQMPNYEMERREGNIYDMITAKDGNNHNNTKFFWRGQNIEFNSWQIAHFRLLGDDRKLPYGTSILEKARRIWKQLILSEDSMLVYRVTRAPERRVYKIFVGNMDDADVNSYVDMIANRFKRTPLIDPSTGQMDLRMNQMSNDQDYFIPVRSEDAQNPIDTLPGASNLDQIADIEYLQKKLFTALRVPKSFLGFEEATGEGKNLALQDIRFSRTINRIQQSMLQELNNIVIIHLFLLGFEDDLDNFTLTLNNPSSQAEMLKIEHDQLKITLYKDMVSDAGNGFGATSMTRAKRDVLGWSDDEIKQDLLEQRMEKAAAAELANSANVIKHTGMFDIVDRIYGDYDLALKGGGAAPEGGEDGGAGGGGGGGLGGSFGGGGMGEDDLDFGEDEDGADGDNADGGLGGELGGDETGDEDNTGEDTGTEAPEPANKETNPISEGVKRVEKLLSEKKHLLTSKLDAREKRYRNLYIDRLIENVSRDQNKGKSVERTKIYDKTIKISDKVNSMIKDIGEMLGE